MQLKVGELAKRSGLTVRTLHHYDEIGLLAPSGRSEAGYRLYSSADVQRLHSIQALRHLGLPLQDIAQLLESDNADPSRIIEQQMRALDQQIAQATELRGRLGLLRDGLVAGLEPDMGNWLETLALMGTYGKYFSASELKQIFQNWKRIEAEWGPLVAKVRDAMNRGVPHDALELQPLINRWMALMVHWMGGDFDLMERWGHMYRQEPSAHGKNRAPASDMIAYTEKAIKHRMALLEKYIPLKEMHRIGFVAAADWDALESSVAALLRAKVSPKSAKAQAAAQRWDSLMNQLTRNDPILRGKLMHASMSEPLLQAGSPLSPAVRAFIQKSFENSA
jgi:DNA-binding transcriptional MerR regulator